YPASCSAEPGLSSAFALAREGSDGLADFESSFYHRARIDEAPLHDFARTQRNHALVAEAVLLGNAPRFAAERHLVTVARKAIEFRPEKARERSRRGGGPRRFERFHVQLEGGGRRVASRAAAGVLLRTARVRRRVCTEKELRVASGRCLHECATVPFPL